MPRRDPAHARTTARRSGIALDLLLLLAAGWLLLRPGGPLRTEIEAWIADVDRRTELQARWPELVSVGGALGGDRSGAPVLVEFTDYRCPFCARAQSEVDALLAGGVAVRVVVRHLPLESIHPDAPLLARVAVCAEEDPAFPAIHRALFTVPAPSPVPGAAPPTRGADDLRDAGEAMRELLARAGAEDPEALLLCARSARAERRIRTDVELALALGLDGTPAFLTRREIAYGALSRRRLRKMLGLPDP